jgi:hypothetical protein
MSHAESLVSLVRRSSIRMSRAAVLAALALTATSVSVFAQAPAADPAPVVAGQPKLTTTSVKDEQAARDLLRASALAIKNMEPVSFIASMEGVGIPISLRGSAEVLYVRSINPPTDTLIRAKGTLETPVSTRPGFEFSVTQGPRVQWYDHDAKVRWDAAWGSFIPNSSPSKLTEGQTQADNFMKQILPRPFLDPEPFFFELREDRAGADIRRFSIVMDGERELDGVMVRFIRVIIKEGETERLIGIGPDNLPRVYEEIRRPGAAPMKRVFKVSNLKPIKDFKTEQIALPNIDGYRNEKLEVATSKPQPDPAAINPGRGFPQVRAGGPAMGQIAPDFELKTVAGESVVLNGLKDHYVIASFVSPQIPGSLQAQSAIVAAAKALEGKSPKPVKFLALASRDGDTAAMTKALADLGSPQQLLLGADRTASLYNVRGFPSVVVIDPQGRVAAFLEGQQPEGRVISEIVRAVTGQAPQPGAN